MLSKMVLTLERSRIIRLVIRMYNRYILSRIKTVFVKTLVVYILHFSEHYTELLREG